MAQRYIRVRGAGQVTPERGGLSARRRDRGLWLVFAVGLLALGTVSLAGGCRNAGPGQAGGTTRSVGAALTATGSTTAASGDQAKADAFAKQARLFAELAALERAQATSVAATISTRPQVTAVATATATAKAVAGTSVTSGAAASGPSTSGSPAAGGAPATIAALPAGVAKYEDHVQKVAVLADRLGANAQRLANFHLARVNQSTGAPGKGCAQ